MGTKEDGKEMDQSVKIMKALSHPARIKIIQILLKNQCNVTHLEKSIGISQSGVSQHLRVLRLSGILEPKRIGKEICYEITTPKIRKILDVLFSK